MGKNNTRNYYIRNVNTHLLNVMENSYYIEVGAVDIHILDRLLKGNVLDLKDLIYLNTLNEGIGQITSDIKNDYNYQLNYLLSFRQKSSTHKFFLTAGLLKYRDEAGLEKFAPIVLIPIDIDYQKRQVRQSVEPIVNRLLLRYLAKNKFDKPDEQNKFLASYDNIRLNSTLAIDKMCMEFAKRFSLEVTPINFLTICNIEYFDFDVKNDLFVPERSIYEKKERVIYEDYFKNIKAILPANLHQKHVLLRAHKGENFAVDGKLGSGKTYTALNIIADAIARDKKILYVNQDLDNVWEVEKNMAYFGFDNVVVNLTTKTSNIDITPIILPSSTNDNFDFQPIEYFDKLEEARYKRIDGFTFNYLSEQQAIINRKYPKIGKVELEVNLEKYEYEHVKKLINTIEDELVKIVDISQNVWRDLQATDNKITSDEIIKKTEEFYEFHKTITKSLTSYCKTFNLKIPNNIHDLNTLIDHVVNFERIKPQVSWKTKEGRNNVRRVLKEIQEAIDENYSLNDYYKENVNPEYKPGKMLDILTNILAKHLSITNDHKYINRLLINNKELDILTNSILENCKNASLNYTQLCNYFGFKKDDEVSLVFLKDMLEYLQINSLPRQLSNLFVTDQKNFLVVGSVVFNNYNIILNVKDKITKYLLPNTKFTYYEAIEIIEDSKTKKKLSNYFDSKLLKKDHLDKDELIKLISEYYYAGKSISGVLDFKDVKMELEKYWQECYYFYRLVSLHIKYTSNIEKFVKKQVSISPNDINRVIMTVKNLINCDEQANSHIKSLENYNIRIFGDYPLDKINKLSSWTTYLINVINLRNEIYTIFKKDIITIVEVIELVEQDNNYINLLEKINMHEEEYVYFLGDNYNKFETVIGDTGIALDHFDDFVEKLNDQNDVDKLLSPKHFDKFLKNTMDLRKLNSEWFTHYRQLSVCFNHGLPALQTNTFDNVLSTLKEFVSQIGQVESVIVIINALKELSEYGLKTLVEKIRRGEFKENICATFCNTIYSKYIDIFAKKYPILLDFTKVKTMFEEFERNEQKYCLNNIQEIRKLCLKKNKSKAVNALFYEYNKYIDGTIKYNNLYLADLNIFNTDLDVSKFDLVIIDDCHLSSANKYTRLDHCKQIIVLGDKSFQSSISNSLLQRIGNDSIVQYDNRYVKMTPKFNNVWNNSNRYIYSYETVVSINSINNISEFAEKIVAYFVKNANNIVNVIIGNEETRRDLYVAIVSILNMSYSFMDVVEIMTYHIRLINVNEEGAKYVNDVFIYYTDFLEYDLAQKNLIFKNYVVVENSVQIYYLASKNETINKEVEHDISSTMVKAVVKPKPSAGIAQMFNDDLSDKGIKVKTGFGKFDITIQKSSKHPVAIIFEGATDSNSFSVIDDYHYYYRQYTNRGWDIKLIYVYDLINNYDAILNKIVSDIEGKTK